MPDLVFVEVFGQPASTREPLAWLGRSLAHAPHFDGHKGNERDSLLDRLRATLNAVSREQDGACQQAKADGVFEAAPKQRLEDYLKAHHSALLRLGLFPGEVQSVMTQLGRSILSLPAIASDKPDRQIPQDAQDARSMLRELNAALVRTGLRDLAAKTFAAVQCTLLDEYVGKHFGVNNGDTSVVEPLEQSITSDFAARLNDPDLEGDADAGSPDEHAPRRSKQYLLMQMASFRVASLRTRTLCRAVLRNRTISNGCKEDLRLYLHTPAARQQCIDLLSLQLGNQLLHPGRSTVEILEGYVHLIQILMAVEPSSVVLREAAKPVMAFLRTRKDAVHIIINSFLERSRDSNGQRRSSTRTICVSVTECMESDTNRYAAERYEGSDLKDMDWIPEAIDSASGEHGRRFLDAFAYLIFLESREVFTQELQNVFAARIIGSATKEQSEDNGDAFQAEMRLLNTLRARVPDYEISKCEIMLRDMLDSQRLNAAIRTLDTDGKRDGLLDFNAIVLSRCYWPIMTNWDKDCNWSKGLETTAQAWAAEYGSHKTRRRLEWLRCAGRATVELELTDRTVVEECAPFQAAVIEQFHGDSKGASPSKNMKELAEATDLDEALVEAACAFWISRQVLVSDPKSPTTWTVQERLPSQEDGSPSTPSQHLPVPAPEATAAPKPKTPAEQLAENKTIYAQFITAMLTNQGGMPAMRIRMMLNMAVPGGFPYGEAELVDFLEGLADEGRVTRQAGVWKAVR